jgi:preprotein translocase subunit SecB
VLEPIDFVGLYEQQSQDPNFGAAMPPAEGNA